MTIEMTEPPAASHDIRIVPASFMDQAEDIWSISFGRSWRREYWRLCLDTIYGAFQKDELHAVAGIMDFDLHFAGRWVPGAGIAAVATAASQRNQGLVRRLISRCLRDLHAREIPVAMLFPFSYPYYEQMGWAITHWLEEIDISTSALRSLAKGRGDARNWRPLQAEACEKMLPIQQRSCERYNLSPARSPLRCRQLAFVPGEELRFFIHDDAYMVWNFGRSTDRKLLVTEFVYGSEAAFWDGIAMLGQMDAQFDSAVWFDHDFEQLFRRHMPDPKPSIKKVPWMMSRIVHLDAFEKLIPKSLKKLKIYDPLGICAPTEGDISVGELVQHVCAVWKTPDERLPAELYGVVGAQPTHTAEFF